MRQASRWRLLVFGLLPAGLTLGPAAPDAPAELAPLAKARYAAAVRQYEETWSYYQQARIDSYQVYVWSRLVLDAHRDMGAKPAEQITALENHLDRMQKLESLIKKVRRLGFGRSYDVGAAEYYRLEAELWLARAKSPK
jgi:FMN phosphatase YigB (HAD superfamily)